jgi:hypothetical protein
MHVRGAIVILCLSRWLHMKQRTLDKTFEETSLLKASGLPLLYSKTDSHTVSMLDEDTLTKEAATVLIYSLHSITAIALFFASTTHSRDSITTYYCFLFVIVVAFGKVAFAQPVRKACILYGSTSRRAHDERGNGMGRGTAGR